METTIPEFDPKIDFSKIHSIILAQKPADFRKGIDGYASLVQGALHLSPVDGSLFLFTNRQKNKLKAILYDGTGYWLVYKRLSRGKMAWPASSNDSDYIRITFDQLKSLLSGLSILPSPVFRPKVPKYV